MTGISKYATLFDLAMAMPVRHQVNCCIDRSGASILDYDVVRNIEDHINKASTDLEGNLRRYTTVPIDPTITSLTGTFEFSRGSVTVNITGGAATSELARGDEVRPDDNEDVRVIVSAVVSNTEITIMHVYYGEVDLDSDASLYVPNIPKEINELCTDHTAWLIWSRTTEDINNPKARKEVDYIQAISDIRSGKFRFVKGGIVKEIPTLTDTDIDKVMTADSLEDYTLNDYIDTDATDDTE